MRKTIYVPSEEVWNEVKDGAKLAGLSVSQYLLGGGHADWGRLGRIEAKLDKLLKPSCSEKPKKVIKTVEDIPDIAKVSKKPKYSQKYKEKNPNERCSDCGQVLKYCFC